MSGDRRRLLSLTLADAELLFDALEHWTSKMNKENNMADPAHWYAARHVSREISRMKERIVSIIDSLKQAGP